MSEVIKEYERYHLMWDALIGVLLGKFNKTQDINYLKIIEIMHQFEKIKIDDSKEQNDNTGS